MGAVLLIVGGGALFVGAVAFEASHQRLLVQLHVFKDLGKIGPYWASVFMGVGALKVCIALGLSCCACQAPPVSAKAKQERAAPPSQKAEASRPPPQAHPHRPGLSLRAQLPRLTSVSDSIAELATSSPTPPRTRQELELALMRGRVAKIKNWLQEGGDPHLPLDPSTLSPIHLAMQWEQSAVLQCFLEGGVDFRRVPTLLHWYLDEMSNPGGVKRGIFDAVVEAIQKQQCENQLSERSDTGESLLSIADRRSIYRKDPHYITTVARMVPQQFLIPNFDGQTTAQFLHYNEIKQVFLKWLEEGLQNRDEERIALCRELASSKEPLREEVFGCVLQYGSPELVRLFGTEEEWLVRRIEHADASALNGWIKRTQQFWRPIQGHSLLTHLVHLQAKGPQQNERRFSIMLCYFETISVEDFIQQEEHLPLLFKLMQGKTPSKVIDAWMQLFLSKWEESSSETQEKMRAFLSRRVEGRSLRDLDADPRLRTLLDKAGT